MISESDKTLFRESVDTIVPITPVNQTDSQVKKPAFTAYSYVTDGTISGEEVVSYAKNGVSKKMINKMKRGHIDKVEEIDLHGYTTIQACKILSEFMYYHQFEYFVRIIHGKGYHSNNGMSVLKTQVVSFLKQHPQVLAFHSCPPKDGGTGAIFALLKHDKS